MDSEDSTLLYSSYFISFLMIIAIFVLIVLLVKASQTASLSETQLASLTSQDLVDKATSATQIVADKAAADALTAKITSLTSQDLVDKATAASQIAANKAAADALTAKNQQLTAQGIANTLTLHNQQIAAQAAADKAASNALIAQTNQQIAAQVAAAAVAMTVPFTLKGFGLWSAPDDKFTCPGTTNRNTTGNNGDFNNYCVFNTAQDAVAAANTIPDCIGYVTFPNGYYQLIKMAPIAGGPAGSLFFSKDPNYVLPNPFAPGNVISLQNMYNNNYMSVFSNVPSSTNTQVDLHESTSDNLWSRWTVVDVGSGNIALKNLNPSTPGFLSVCDGCTSMGNGSVDVHGNDSTQLYTQLTPKLQADGTYLLLSVYNGNLLKACNGCWDQSPVPVIVTANQPPNATGNFTNWKVSKLN